MNSTGTYAIILAAFMMFGIGAALTHEAQQTDAAAINFATYRNAVNSYALHNAATGIIADSVLELPAGFIRYPEWSGRVAGSTVYVFGAASPALINEVGQLYQCAASIGVNRMNRLHNACDGDDSGIGLPTFIPLNALVSVIER